MSIDDLSVCCKREDMSVDDLSVWCGREETHLLMTCLLQEGVEMSVDDLSVCYRGMETHLVAAGVEWVDRDVTLSATTVTDEVAPRVQGLSLM